MTTEISVIYGSEKVYIKLLASLQNCNRHFNVILSCQMYIHFILRADAIAIFLCERRSESKNPTPISMLDYNEYFNTHIVCFEILKLKLPKLLFANFLQFFLPLKLFTFYLI